MVHRASVSEQFAINLREAEGAARAVSEHIASIDDTVARTKDIIRESRRLMDQADELLSRERGCLSPTRAAQLPFTPMLASAATRSPAE